MDYINTSYFAKYRGNCGISIANTSPPGFMGKFYKPLVPNWDYVKQFKQDGNQESFAVKYFSDIMQLDPYKVLSDLWGLVDGVPVLICWEKGFCHRLLAGEWLKNETGIYVVELE